MFGDKLALSRVEKKREREGGFLRACLSPLLAITLIIHFPLTPASRKEKTGFSAMPFCT